MEEKEFDYINVIPLVDVMLVLLTITLTTSTFLASGAIQVELPKVDGKHQGAAKVQVVEIDSFGTVYFQGGCVDLSSLKKGVSDVDKETPFLIKADKNVELQKFVEVLDLLKTDGFTRVSLQTEWKGK